MASANLSDEEVLWGSLFVWIHKRAEFLRQQEAAAVSAYQGQSTAAASQPATEASRLVDSSPVGTGGQK